MNRPTGLTDQVKMETDVSGVQYGPAGELKAITYFGNYETRTYNAMLQMTDLKIGSWAGWADLTNLHYSLPATQNNGKIMTQKDMNSGEEVQYVYDSLNRMIAATTTAA